MSRSKIRRLLPVVSLLALLALPSCATHHLLNWNSDKPSLFNQSAMQDERQAIHPAGTIVAMPAAVVWDVATFPFQWLWGFYPFGGKLSPDTIDS